MLVITTTKKIKKLKDKINERTIQLSNKEDELKDKDISLTIANDKVNQLTKQLKDREELDLKSNSELKVKLAKTEDELLVKNFLLETAQENLNKRDKQIEDNKNKVAEAEKTLEENKQMKKKIISYTQSVGLFKMNAKKKAAEMKSIKTSLAILGYEIVNGEVVKINSVKTVETAKKVNDYDKAAVLYDGLKKDLKKYISNGKKLEYVTNKKNTEEDPKEEVKEQALKAESLVVDEVHEMKIIETDQQVATVDTTEEKVVSVKDKNNKKKNSKKKFNKKR